MKINEWPGHLSDENIETLQKYAKLMEGVVVDIGTMAGKSAFSIALGNPWLLVMTVDPTDATARIEEGKDCFGVDNVEYFQMTSEEFGSSVCPEVIGGCFIDGQHNYFGVKIDIKLIAEKVRPGGYVMFHDCNLYFNTIGKAVDEYEGKLYQKISETGGYIIGNKKSGSIYTARRI